MQSDFFGKVNRQFSGQCPSWSPISTVEYYSRVVRFKYPAHLIPGAQKAHS